MTGRNDATQLGAASEQVLAMPRSNHGLVIDIAIDGVGVMLPA